MFVWLDFLNSFIAVVAVTRIATICYFMSSSNSCCLSLHENMVFACSVFMSRLRQGLIFNCSLPPHGWLFVLIFFTFFFFKKSALIWMMKPVMIFCRQKNYLIMKVRNDRHNWATALWLTTAVNYNFSQEINLKRLPLFLFAVKLLKNRHAIMK